MDKIMASENTEKFKVKPQPPMPDWSKPDLTMGDLYNPAMNITDSDYAERYMRCLVDYLKRFDKNARRMSLDKIENIQRINLGYYAGYFDGATMSRVNRVFNTAHPIFGSTPPTKEEAFEMGKKRASKKQAQAAAPKRKVRSVIID